MHTALPREMFDFYAVSAESTRLHEGVGELERLRTQELVARHLPPPPATVLDVGGAAGVHALWLARQGHTVHLVDVVPLHVTQAQDASDAQPDHPLASCTVGDARDLAADDASVDAVLLLGPLYHLTDRADRVRALTEARRVLRPGGVVIGAAISRYASFMNVLAADLLDDEDFLSIVRQDLRDGQHRNHTEKDYFTTAFFHHPDELQRELSDSGFDGAELAAVEGPAMWVTGFEAAWSDPGKRTLLLEFLRSIEHDPTIVASGSHFLGIARA